jgi:hypothetical protein
LKMKTITKAAWDRVITKAADVANATQADDDLMERIHCEQMLGLLDELETEFGTQSRILDTRADYLDDPLERRSLYLKALELARRQRDQNEIDTVLQSLSELDDELSSVPDA